MRIRIRSLAAGLGFFGLGPRDVQERDVVFVLYGCSVPVMLRRVEGGEHWSLVGEVFVAGIMDGEVVAAVGNTGAGSVAGGISAALLQGTEETVEIR